ncbi:ankyrin repeat domain-containing protein [Maribacter sp. Asnod1-A12]|uniref:ankyrin repeat domain-containing protein n=1 Tax=Maribacter sp. Asnod1-A12 TaxID=3160576 RepID=UPI00386D57F7
MKKVVLTLSMVALTLGSTLKAATSENLNAVRRSQLVTSVDISSFCKAVIQGDVEMVKKLIVLGEDLNQKSQGMTPAMFAARYNKAEILEILINNGADLNAKSDQGFNAKRYAELSNAIDALQVIEIASGS